MQEDKEKITQEIWSKLLWNESQRFNHLKRNSGMNDMRERDTSLSGKVFQTKDEN